MGDADKLLSDLNDRQREAVTTLVAPLAILAAAQLSEFAPAGDPAALMRASATLTFLVGAILLLASLLRLGFIANFISDMTHYDAGPENIARVAARLAAAGWPLSGINDRADTTAADSQS